ncbi:MAG: peptide ABC transporter substrate-binding protein, partial [Ktedonobacteraceae bacterium]
AQEGISDFATLDPALVTDEASTSAIDLIFTGLVQLDDQLRVKGQLAASWDLGADSETWTFHLRPNLKFSDGSALTSKDVAYSIDRALQPGVKSPLALTYLLIKDADKLNRGQIKTLIGDSIMTPDDSTVVIKASTKGIYFLDALTYPTSYVVEKSLINKYGNSRFTDHLTEGGGAGPFVVQSYIHSRQIVFAPNRNYYGPKPQLREVIMPFYSSIDTGYEAYQVGQIANTAIPAEYSTVAEKRTGEFHKVAVLAIRYYAMNYLVKPFDNIHIRQAFALALNKDALVHFVLKDIDIPTNHIVPQGMPGYYPSLTGPDGTKGTSGNAVEARKLLQQGMQEEGWTSISQIPPIRFTYNSGSSTIEDEVTTVIQMWQTVLGISVKPDPIDFNRLLGEMSASINNPKGLQFWRFTWVADYPDPQDWLTLQFDKGAPNNVMNYGQNSSADALHQQATQLLMEQADFNQNQSARLSQYGQAEQQLVKDVAWLPMYQVGAVYLLKPYVHGLVDNPLGLTPPDDWSNIYITAH